MPANFRQPHQDPMRGSRPVGGEVYRRIANERDALVERLDEIDRQLGELARARREVVAKLLELRGRLWPPLSKRGGRQPEPDGRPALPPVAADAFWLWGRRLRSVCLALLRRAGRLSLRELHALLHHHGYRIENENATKALSDALAYECECGRARRVARGVYEVVGSEPIRPGRHGNPELRPYGPVRDRLLDEVFTPAA